MCELLRQVQIILYRQDASTIGNGKISIYLNNSFLTELQSYYEQ